MCVLSEYVIKEFMRILEYVCCVFRVESFNVDFRRRYGVDVEAFIYLFCCFLCDVVSDVIVDYYFFDVFMDYV